MEGYPCCWMDCFAIGGQTVYHSKNTGGKDSQMIVHCSMLKDIALTLLLLCRLHEYIQVCAVQWRICKINPYHQTLKIEVCFPMWKSHIHTALFNMALAMVTETLVVGQTPFSKQRIVCVCRLMQTVLVSMYFCTSLCEGTSKWMKATSPSQPSQQKQQHTRPVEVMGQPPAISGSL